MGWAKFDDQFSEHPKVVAAGPMAELLAMRGVIYCARYETDGHIQAAQLPRLAVGITSARKQAAKLVDVGLWHVDPDGDGWWVHDFLDYHPSREDKEREREEARERMAKHRAKKKGSSDRSSDDVQPNKSGTNGRSSGTPTRTRTPTASPQPPPSGGAVDNVHELTPRQAGTNPRSRGTSPRQVAEAETRQTKQTQGARSRGAAIAAAGIDRTEAMRLLQGEFEGELADLALAAYEETAGGPG